MRHIMLMWHVIMAVMIASITCACSHTDEPDQPVAEDTRTVLVYMVANNNLGQNNYDSKNIDQMKEAVRQGCLRKGDHLMLYHHDYRSTGILYDVTEDGTLMSIKDYGSSDNLTAVDPERMRSVIDDMRSYADTKSYALVLWSHGTGWIESENSRSSVVDADASADDDEWLQVNPAFTSFGADGGKVMNVNTLARALDGDHFDFIYFDCCHMATVEVAYALRSCTDYVIGSVTELVIEGMPYDKTLFEMFVDEFDAAKLAYTTYSNHINHRNGISMSAVDTHNLEMLAQATRNVMTHAVDLANTDFTPKKLWRTTGAGITPTYTYDMRQYIHALTTDESLLKQWDIAFDAAVIASYSTDFCFTVDLTDFSGLGCHAPLRPSDVDIKGYRNQTWWTDVVSHNPHLQ